MVLSQLDLWSHKRDQSERRRLSGLRERVPSHVYFAATDWRSPDWGARVWTGEREQAEAYTHTLHQWQLTAILEHDD